MSENPRPKRDPVVVWVAPLVIMVFGALFVPRVPGVESFFTSHGNSSSGSTSNQQSPSSQPQPPAQPSNTPSSSPSAPPPSPLPTRAGPTTIDLSELSAVDADSSDLDIDKTASISGIAYLHSIVNTCYLFCNAQVAYAEFDLGRKYSTFTAEVGVNDDASDASQVGTFSVYVDGSLVESIQAGFGKPTPISVNVTGGLRLRIESGIAGTVSNPVQAGANSAVGVSNGLPDLVWGTPTLTTE